MITYQYSITESDKGERTHVDEDMLDQMGKEGWELVTVLHVKDNTRFYFKRAVIDTPEA